MELIFYWIVFGLHPTLKRQNNETFCKHSRDPVDMANLLITKNMDIPMKNGRLVTQIFLDLRYIEPTLIKNNLLTNVNSLLFILFRVRKNQVGKWPAVNDLSQFSHSRILTYLQRNDLLAPGLIFPKF